MKKSQEQSNSYWNTPIFEQLLSHLREELGGMYAIKSAKKYSAILVARTPFTLGMVLANIYSNFTQKGVGWDRLDVDVKRLTISVKIPQAPGCGALKVTMK